MKITVTFWSEEDITSMSETIKKRIDKCCHTEYFTAEEFVDHVNVYFDDALAEEWHSKRLAKIELLDLIDSITDLF